MSRPIFSAVAVTYNTKPEAQRFYESFRAIYPDIPLIIIDGSSSRDQCYQYIRRINDKNLSRFQFNANIGHGKGLNFGIAKATSPNILIIDSDCYLTGAVAEPMIDLMRSDIYGVGQIVQVNRSGINTDGGIQYLHPFCAMLNRFNLDKFPHFIHHGAPFIKTMLALDKQSTYKLIDFPVERFTIHEGRGTRRLNPKEFAGKNWDRSYLQGMTRARGL